MKVRLPDRLSPRAKKVFLSAPAGGRVRVLLSVSATANLPALTHALESLGVQISSISPETHSVGASVPSESLPKVAAMREVTYVDSASPFTISSTDLR